MTSKKYEGIKQEQMTRTKVIQDLIDTHKLKSYLEIGVQESANGSQIKCEHKIGIDIKKPKNANEHFNSFYEGKSRDFFKSNECKYDIIFIDGDHSLLEVINDFEQSIHIANRFIVLHDAYPQEEEATKWPNKTPYGTYNGEVYKILLCIHNCKIPYTLHTFDHGVLVIDMHELQVCNALGKILILDNTISSEINWKTYSKTEFDGNKSVHFDGKKRLVSTISEDTITYTDVTKTRKPMSEETKQKIRDAKKNKNKSK